MRRRGPYILASGSPRRREILDRAGISYSLLVTDTDESHADMAPDALVLELSRRKAEAAAALCETAEGVIIAADTIVALDGKILGKPTDRAESERMIRAISGRTHEVFTGVCLLRVGDKACRSFYERTEVMVRELKDEEIRAYVDSGEGDDKAGAYGIQGEFGKYITEFAGDYENVMGLPAKRLLKELEVFENE